MVPIHEYFMCRMVCVCVCPGEQCNKINWKKLFLAFHNLWETFNKWPRKSQSVIAFQEEIETRQKYCISVWFELCQVRILVYLVNRFRWAIGTSSSSSFSFLPFSSSLEIKIGRKVLKGFKMIHTSTWMWLIFFKNIYLKQTMRWNYFQRSRTNANW